jgi:hypothetical protein
MAMKYFRSGATVFGYDTADPAQAALIAAATAAGWTDVTASWPPAPTAAQIAMTAYAAFVAGGLSVTSTGTPALSGLYAIDSQSQVDIAAEAQFVSTFAEFTTGTTTNLPWPMPSGGVVLFPATAAFLSFAKAAAQAVAAAKLALFQLAAMPAATATIP